MFLHEGEFMNKTIKVFLCLLGLGTVGVGSYKLLETKPQQSEFPASMSVVRAHSTRLSIELKDVKETIKEATEDLVLFVRSDDQLDANYVENTLIADLANEYEDSALPELLYVNISSKNTTVTRLHSVLDIYNTPALVIVRKADTKKGYKVVSKLEYTKEKPFDKDQLRTWLFENNQWNGPFGAN